MNKPSTLCAGETSATCVCVREKDRDINRICWMFNGKTTQWHLTWHDAYHSLYRSVSFRSVFARTYLMHFQWLITMTVVRALCVMCMPSCGIIIATGTHAISVQPQSNNPRICSCVMHHRTEKQASPKCAIVRQVIIHMLSSICIYGECEFILNKFRTM